MELLQAGTDSVVLQMSKRDFFDIMSAVSAVGQSYNSVDPSILDMDELRVKEVLSNLTAVMKTIPTPTEIRPSIRAVS